MMMLLRRPARPLLVIGLIALLALAASCSSDDAPASFTIAGDTTTLAVDTAVGDEFDLSVASNPATGYSWAHDIVPAGAVEEVSSEYVPSDPSGELDGSGGTQTWRMRAVTAPAATITLRETPPGASRPSREVTVEVTITP